MNSLTRIMSYDKTKINQENCNCEECVSVKTVKSENQIVEYPKLSDEEIEQIINERYFNKDEKTKTFIRKALRKHGNRYDYSKVVYVRSDVNVEIICRVKGHQSFPQKPNRHLQGRGCTDCGGTKKLTTKEFIKRAREIHGNTYDYSKVKYKNMKTDVVIICPIHGDFLQTPNDHIHGCSGCSLCGYIKTSEMQRLTKEEFIKRAREIHGNTYDYSKVVYVNMLTEVIITCPKHGDFPQIPSSHLNTEGCRKCQYEKLSNDQKLTTEEFIKRAKEIHGDFYDYSKVEYINYNTEVIIICPKHEGFPQKPSKHLIGQGCPKCNKNKGEELVRKFLIEKGIEFKEQKSFKDCKNINSLRFDFYLPKYNLCIESDGSPHFQKIKWSKAWTDERMEKELRLNQHRDDIKNKYCEKNGIALLRLNNLKTFEEKLTEYFQNHEIKE